MATNEPQDVAAQGEATEPTDDPGGSYEVLRNRLADQGRELAKRTEALNEQRKETFGGQELQVVGNVRVRTENNCIPAEIVSVGELLLFGYTVHMGLKQRTEVSDVFSLHKYEVTDDGFEFPAVPFDQAKGLLDDESFVRELAELYQYYKDPYLLQLRATTDGKLLAVFRVGDSIDDVKVFVWNIDKRGNAQYIDNRGDKLYKESFPPSHDFVWKPTTRDMQVPGRFPHINLEDECFVETVGGDLTIKIEDNTEDGQGIYREPVQEPDQSLDDAQFFYARVGSLILIKVLPYREEVWRYFVFNTKTQEAARIDAIGRACVQLPEDHGIIFPGGYYLQTGVYKVFDEESGDLVIQQAVKSPNGEDVLYVFLTRDDGNYLLLPYNLIRKEVQNPIHCHGYTLFEDGKLVIFRAISDDPTRVHPMQIWQTPFTSVEFAASAPTDDSFLAKVGNADLVRGISDAYSVRRLTAAPTPARHIFEDIVRSTTRMIDSYYWLASDEVGNLADIVKEVRKTAELIIDEFEKVQALQRQARESLDEARQRQHELIRDLRPSDWHEIERFMRALADLRHQRGRLITLREMRFMDLEAVDQLEEEAIDAFDRVSRGTADFLQTDEAFVPLHTKLEELLGQINEIEKTNEAEPITEELDQISEGLDVLSEVSSGLQLDDPTGRTKILESISEVFALLNRVRATLEVRRKELLSSEGRAEFAAQFKLLGQSVDSALARADTPEACDELLSQLMLQLEEVESKFSEFDEFLGDLATKREEIYEAFSGRKQTLVEERQRRAQNMMTAANRILEGAARRAKAFKSADDLNAYFSSDPMLLKLRDLVKKLVELGDTVKADELESKLKSTRQDALRILRDKTELFEEGENVIKFGKHRFSVNTQPLELTMLPYDEGMAFHLTGTDFSEPVEDQAFLATKDLWDQSLVSENRDVYRGEYLAASIMFDAEQEQKGLSVKQLNDAALDEGKGLLDLVRKYAADRYDEGYDRGVHDADAAAILGKLMSIRSSVGLLRFAPTPRALACFFWAYFDGDEQRDTWVRRARSLHRLRSSFQFSEAINDLSNELAGRIAAFNETARVPCTEADYRLAGQYLAEELMARDPVVFTTSAEANNLRDQLIKTLDYHRSRSEFEDDLHKLEDRPAEAFNLAYAWIDAFVRNTDREDIKEQAHARTEAAVLALTGSRLRRETSSAMSMVEVTGLLGQHRRIDNGTLKLRLDEFLDRVGHFVHDVVPRYREFRRIRADLIDKQRRKLRLDEFKPRVLTSFVRNKLINEVYLPLIGDNLAKQLGTVGETKRTDLMGLLLLISPPGYGKTTLMEYLSSQLGVIFMKVNGPSLGHEVVSLDPEEAPNATAAQEVNKINLALEMGNNVMLYLDDIQHTNAELLQKFISLCDAQRRIEGIWNGQTKTYDLRGKKFCMVMAGNPYTESGERFQIPDMLSNRADTYNLGDILEGKDEAFALSYIENALTSSPTLSPLTSRSQNDLYLLIRMSQGEEIPPTDLSHAYSATELNDFQAVLKHLRRVQDMVLKVNQQYIASAAQEDAYRTEPPFQLQGSYRNMNKLAEKVVPAMNKEELERIIDDHYLGEAQTLTSGAEWNLLKLRELRGVLTDEQRERLEEVRGSFQRNKRLGGSEEDPAVRAVSQLNDIGESLMRIHEGLGAWQTYTQQESLGTRLDTIGQGLQALQAHGQREALGKRLDAIREGLQGIQAVDQLGDNLGSRLDTIGQGLQALQAHGQREALGKRLDSIGQGLQALQAHGQQEALGKRLDSIGQGLQALQAHGQREALGKRLDAISKGLQSTQAVEQLGDSLGKRLDTIGQGLQGFQNVNKVGVALAQRLDTIGQGLEALQSLNQQADIGKHLDQIGQGLQGFQAINKVGVALAQRLDNIGKGLAGIQAVNQLGQLLAQRLDAINCGLQNMQGVDQLGESLGTRLEGIGTTLREVASRQPEASPAEQSLAQTSARLQEAIDKLQQPQLEVKLDTIVPEPMTEMLKEQVALAENVGKMLYAINQSLEEGANLQVQLSAVLGDIQALSHKLSRARVKTSATQQPTTSATARVVNAPEPQPPQRHTPPPQARPQSAAQQQPPQRHTPPPQARPQSAAQQRQPQQPPQRHTPPPQARPQSAGQQQPPQRHTPPQARPQSAAQQPPQRHTPPPQARPQSAGQQQPPQRHTPPPQARPQSAGDSQSRQTSPKRPVLPPRTQSSPRTVPGGLPQYTPSKQSGGSDTGSSSRRTAHGQPSPVRTDRSQPSTPSRPATPEKTPPRRPATTPPARGPSTPSAPGSSGQPRPAAPRRPATPEQSQPPSSPRPPFPRDPRRSGGSGSGQGSGDKEK